MNRVPDYWKKLFAFALLALVVEWLVVPPRRAEANTVSGAPQYKEIVNSPCVYVTFVAGDGGQLEVPGGLDTGVPKLVPGGRYRIFSDNKVFLARAAWGTVVTCSMDASATCSDAGGVVTCDAGIPVNGGRCFGYAPIVAGQDGIPIEASSPEEMTFSKPADAPGIVYGQCAGGLTCKVSFCLLTTTM